MNCRFCDKKMWLDDYDCVRKGNCKKYWLCDGCNTSCIEVIICNIPVEESWHREDNQGNVLFYQTISKL